MPVQRVDNSFDTSNSMMVKSVESDNLQELGKFTEVFESASTEYKKMQKSDVEKKSKSVVVRDEEKKTSLESEKDSFKQLEQKNEELISLGKIRYGNSSGKSKVEIKKTKKSESIKENITDITKEFNAVELESTVVQELHTDSNPIVYNSEIADKSTESFIVADAVNNLIEISGLVTPDKLKGSAVLKTVSNEKKSSADKRNVVKKDSKAGRKKLSILDLRQTEAKTANIKESGAAVERENQRITAGSFEQLQSDNAEDAKPIVVELTHLKDNFSSESKTLTTASSSSLMKQLEENINSKIVKQSSIILKDGGSGEIKLILKPEQLGSVRIRLTLTDNRIAGQIIVDSSAVKDIFEQNLQNLERAFKENGFDTAALNVSVGGDHSGSREREQDSDISKQIELIDENIPTMIRESENLIDLVV